jgi:hypothetical protein
MNNLEAGDLTVHVSVPAAGAIRLDWLGKSNNREPGKILAPFLREVTQKAVEQGELVETRPTVEMHFERLEHFNSSTITAIIQFIQTSRASGVALVISFDGQQKWQRLSFDALRIFDKNDGLLTFKNL